ncbi:MAG: hypothetical protein ABI361_03295 [Nitrososphaera sp.]
MFSASESSVAQVVGTPPPVHPTIVAPANTVTPAAPKQPLPTGGDLVRFHAIVTGPSPPILQYIKTVNVTSSETKAVQALFNILDATDHQQVWPHQYLDDMSLEDYNTMTKLYPFSDVSQLSGVDPNGTPMHAAAFNVTDTNTMYVIFADK